jgi:hypothetical protein
MTARAHCFDSNPVRFNVTGTFRPDDHHQSRDMRRYVQAVEELNQVECPYRRYQSLPWNDDRSKGGAID